MDITATLDRVNGKLKSLSPRWYRVGAVAWQRHARSNSNIIAASIGFYTLICLAPIALLMVWALQLVMGPGGGAYEWLQRNINRLAGEAAGGIMGQVDALVKGPEAHVAGVLSFFLLVWAGPRLFEALEISLTEIWPGEDERGVVGRKLVALASLFASGLLLIVAFLLTTLLPALIRALDRIPMLNVDQIFFLQPGLRIAVELIVAFGAFFLLFKFIPVGGVPNKVAAAGAIFTAAAWRIITPIFRMTVASSSEDSAVYGGLAGVVMFLTWAFFSAQILLLGAHFAAAYEHVMVRERPESLDDRFIRVHEEVPEARPEARPQDREGRRGPESYPPPGRV
ncbi:MAG: YihY/virulence factor BrkB family protein [Armatimonadota bacterium]